MGETDHSVQIDDVNTPQLNQIIKASRSLIGNIARMTVDDIKPTRRHTHTQKTLRATYRNAPANYSNYQQKKSPPQCVCVCVSAVVLFCFVSFIFLWGERWII